MHRLARVLLACSAAIYAGACTPPEPPPPPPLSVSIDKTQVPADGAATATITIGDASAPVRVTATQGSFKESGRSVANLEGNGTLTLLACDSRTVPGCGGVVKVNAVAENGALGSVVTEFVQLENCLNGTDDDGDGNADCADEDCSGRACELSGGVGTGTCDDSGLCVCTAGVVEVCTDHQDNNCDGKVDCADTACNGQYCVLPTGVGGTCTAGACACPNKPEACNDGVDNDCDGKTDCEDSDCRPVGNDIGKVCDDKGNTCSPPISGVSTCSVCGGNSKSIESPEVSCYDGADNDCDGVSDCQDPDCAGVTCSSSRKLCNGETLQCECPGGQSEMDCGDGVDNDCDGKQDCADSDCSMTSGHSCTPDTGPAVGTECTLAGKCECTGNGGTPENKTEASCGDGFDNDCDGFIDCQDPNCRPTGTTGLGKNCSQPTATPPTVGMACDLSGTCICSGNGGNPESKEVSCSDGKDNDCDGKIDCQDPDCAGLLCGANGHTCAGTTCACPGGTTETCNDLVDNNCDGKIDCSDPQCPVGSQCDPSSANYKCTTPTSGTALVCKDITSSVTLQLVAAPTRLAANGTETSTITVTLKDGATLLANKTVSFAVTSGTGTVSPASATTNAQGVATVTYTAGTTGGPNIVTGTYYTGTQNITGSAVIDTPALGQVKFVNQQFTIMGVRYSSTNETNDITFQVLDAANQPYPPGLTVNFTHAPVGGSFIGATANCTMTSCTASAVTDASGFVKVTLHSGTVASVVSVSASASAGGGTGTATASNIAIVGAKPAGRNISVTCTPRNIPAFTDHDCTNSNVQATVNCVASLGDRFNNILGVPATVTFSSEAGLASGPAQNDPHTGTAKGTISVGGNKLPVDVPAQPGEWSATYVDLCDGTNPRTHNPRDGLVTVIVTASGEEGFVDGSNGQPGNGIYDPGENFIDLGEPFVDSNDNGTRDNNEVYIDTNGNNAWDGPNGSWDDNTTIWAETRIVYTGFPSVVADGSGNYVISRWFDSAVPPVGGPTMAPSFNVQSSSMGQMATTQGLGVYFGDWNFNKLTSATTFGASVVSGGVTATITSTPASVDTLGMAFTQQFCSATTGGTCSNTCQSAPCYVQTNVGNFSYGNRGVIQIKGGSMPGTGEVRATATYGGVATQLSVFGTVN